MKMISRTKNALWIGILPAVILLNSQAALGLTFQPVPRDYGTREDFIRNYIAREISVADWQRYFNVLSALSVPSSASGRLSGSVLGGDVYVSDYDHFDVSYTKDFPLSGTNGVRERLDFILAGGPVSYTYDVPYTISFDFPTEVFPGQRIFLNPTITWGNPWLQADHSFTFRTDHRLWLNIPYDATAPLDILMSQHSDRLEVSGSIPLGPVGVPYSFTLDSNSTPPLDSFGDGEVTYQGVTNKLGGTGSISTSGGNLSSVGETSVAVSTNLHGFGDAWYSSGDQITFAKAIPYVGVVATALDVLGFDLDHAMDVDPYRQDTIVFNVTSSPYLDVPDDVTPGTEYAFNVSVPMEYKGWAYSNFQYGFSTKIVFDGPYFDKKTLLNVPLGSIDLGFGSTPTEFTGVSMFTLSGRVPVVSNCDARVAAFAARGQYLTASDYQTLCFGDLLSPRRMAATFNQAPLVFRPAGSTPVTPADTHVEVAVVAPSGPIFSDDFTDGAAPTNWRQDSGAWSANRGTYRTTSTRKNNVSTIDQADPKGLALETGVVQAKIKLTPSYGRSGPNGQILFAYQDAANYRYAKVSGTQLEIGQVGVVGNVMGGVKKRVFKSQPLNRFAVYTVKIFPDGWVRICKGTSTKPALSYRFLAGAEPSVVQGGVGLAATKAKTIFDNVMVWDDTGL